MGLLLQDFITISDNLKMLAGGRFDIVNQDSYFQFTFAGDVSEGEDAQQNQAFSPRIGLVYQPIEPISLYGSFSQSFAPNSATDVTGELLDPERGTQYEIGVRGEWFDGRLLANLAAYEITKRNVATTDPLNPDC